MLTHSGPHAEDRQMEGQACSDPKRSPPQSPDISDDEEMKHTPLLTTQPLASAFGSSEGNLTCPRRCTINEQRWMGPTWKTAAGVKPSELGPARNRVSLPADASRSPDANVALPRAPGSAFLAVDTQKGAPVT